MKTASNAFARALAMFAAIAAAMALPMIDQRQALQQIGPYKSRGKGRGLWGGHKYTARMNRPIGRTYPMNGAREVARRQRQIARGILKVSA